MQQTMQLQCNRRMLCVVLRCIFLKMQRNTTCNAHIATMQHASVDKYIARVFFVCYNEIKKKVVNIPYIDFPENLQGQKQRKQFWLSEDGLTLIAGWRRNGISIKDVISNYIGVSPTGFYGWYRESEELRKACAVSAEITNSNVENALYRRAVGYDYWEEQWELVEGEMILVKKFKKHLPPDTKAILHWLFNRMPTVWRSIQEPLESTQYAETIKNIVVAMKQVAETGKECAVSTSESEVS